MVHILGTNNEVSEVIPPRLFEIQDVSDCIDVNEVMQTLDVGDYSKVLSKEKPSEYSWIVDDRGDYIAPVKNTYDLLQPTEAFAFLDCLKDQVDFEYARAGFTHAGRQLFIQGDLGDFEVPAHSDRKKGDILNKRIVARTSFDGSLSTMISIAVLRVWCDNGCASWNKDDRIAKVKHTRNQRASMKLALEQATGIEQVIQNLESDIVALSDREVTPAQFDAINEIVNKGESKQAETKREAVKAQFTNERLGAFGETAWDVFNAFTAVQNHDQTYRQTEQTTREENRFRALADSAYPVKVRRAINEVLAL